MQDNANITVEIFFYFAGKIDQDYLLCASEKILHFFMGTVPVGSSTRQISKIITSFLILNHPEHFPGNRQETGLSCLPRTIVILNAPENTTLFQRHTMMCGDHMRKNYSILGGMLLLAVICSIGTATAQESSTDPQGVDFVPDDIRPFEGSIGADNPLYGLKVAMEDLDETFTFNDTQRLEKQVDHAQLRIAEFRRELELNRTDSAERVLELYRQKLNLTERSLTGFGPGEPGLLHAQEMISLHQSVLASLIDSHPDVPGLSRAYNNSLSLGDRFSAKTAMKFTRITAKDNKTVLRAERLDTRDQIREDTSGSSPENDIQNKNDSRERTKDQKDISTGNQVTPKPGNKEDPGKK